MAKTELTKSAVGAAPPQAQAVELRDTLVPGFLCKIRPAGRRVFMLHYRTNSGERRKPALGLFGELIVEQTRSLAQEWLAQVRRSGDPAADKAAARKEPTVKELWRSSWRITPNSTTSTAPSTGISAFIDRCIVPILGRVTVQDV